MALRRIGVGTMTRRIGLVAWMVVATAMVATAAAQEIPRGKVGGPRALKRGMDPGALPKVTAACVDGATGWHEVPAGKGREVLLAALKSFAWRAHSFAEPDWDCRMSVEILCAPDLDGDKKGDFLARLRWRVRGKQAQGLDCNQLSGDDPSLIRHEAILVTNRQVSASSGPTWVVVDVLSLNADTGIGGMAHTRVDFVQLPNGRVGLRCKTQTEDLGTGCEVLGYWVGEVTKGKVEKVGEADPEFCVPD